MFFHSHVEISVDRSHFAVSQISKQLKDDDQKQLGTEAEIKMSRNPDLNEFVLF